MWVVFNYDDRVYLSWLLANPEGYVVNTKRSIPADYLVLHTARCSRIHQYNDNAKPGGFTEGDYIKVCSASIDDLLRWVRANDLTTFSSRCDHCQP